ncbi:leader peptidase (prepilin peptidase)/N-methyltransferase [Actinoplanes campanulatus]|uniref:Leader peptidase (Prepilin peptidase)/N-methyltransferase n=1 Tax=Actinoplanes campanulatus TaxID=113559 RepID=A0A7W5AM63_9ACTN|nr:A24 family peptidase [Actinoplanes campanulatus]MBB3098851.1 leader peptidase (prepilin peptidase)/N-methyltransferase [Actinoplanes campanulatus]GGN36723.1 prepilin peptidase [Actinoplanes campanulatus]GID41988.1 prepilin peptidase [Actinoplanes campanulatus]
MPQTLLIGIVALLGLAVGSFLNVVIHRVPRDESLVRPGSHCPECGNPVRARHNVPVLGWLVLRGRCADCGTRISARYPLVEAGTAVLFAAVAARFGWSWELPAYLYLAAVAIALAMIDLDVMRLPNKIVLPSYGVAVALLAPVSLAAGSPGDLLRGALAAVLLYLVYRVLAIWGMGGGDVKLAPLLGFYLGWLGWNAVTVGAFAAFLLGGLVGGVLLALKLVSRKTRVPFGPYMLAGAFLAVFAAAPLADWYTTTVLLPSA